MFIFSFASTKFCNFACYDIDIIVVIKLFRHFSPYFAPTLPLLSPYLAPTYLFTSDTFRARSGRFVMQSL